MSEKTDGDRLMKRLVHHLIAVNNSGGILRDADFSYIEWHDFDIRFNKTNIATSIKLHG